MKITVLAKSSGGDSYEVSFIKTGDLLSVFCNCPAGEWGRYCKHKWKLLHGDESMLFDPSQAEELKTVVSWASASGLEDLYKKVEQYEKELHNIERIQKKDMARTKEKNLKRNEIMSEAEFRNAWSEVADREMKKAYLKYLVDKEKRIAEKKFQEGF
jgi:hypothetical protein